MRIQGLVEERGLPAAEVAAMHDLDVADVYAALTYYYEHPDEMERVREQQRTREQVARDTDAPTIGELTADHEAGADDEESA